MCRAGWPASASGTIMAATWPLLIRASKESGVQIP